jgi:hypothetical protein
LATSGCRAHASYVPAYMCGRPLMHGIAKVICRSEVCVENLVTDGSAGQLVQGAHVCTYLVSALWQRQAVHSQRATCSHHQGHARRPRGYVRGGGHDARHGHDGGLLMPCAGAGRRGAERVVVGGMGAWECSRAEAVVQRAADERFSIELAELVGTALASLSGKSLISTQGILSLPQRKERVAAFEKYQCLKLSGGSGDSPILPWRRWILGLAARILFVAGTRSCPRHANPDWASQMSDARRVGDAGAAPFFTARPGWPHCSLRWVKIAMQKPPKVSHSVAGVAGTVCAALFQDS